MRRASSSAKKPAPPLAPATTIGTPSAKVKPRVGSMTSSSTQAVDERRSGGSRDPPPVVRNGSAAAGHSPAPPAPGTPQERSRAPHAASFRQTHSTTTAAAAGAVVTTSSTPGSAQLDITKATQDALLAAGAQRQMWCDAAATLLDFAHATGVHLAGAPDTASDSPAALWVEALKGTSAAMSCTIDQEAGCGDATGMVKFELSPAGPSAQLNTSSTQVANVQCGAQLRCPWGIGGAGAPLVVCAAAGDVAPGGAQRLVVRAEARDESATCVVDGVANERGAFMVSDPAHNAELRVALDGGAPALSVRGSGSSVRIASVAGEATVQFDASRGTCALAIHSPTLAEVVGVATAERSAVDSKPVTVYTTGHDCTLTYSGSVGPVGEPQGEGRLDVVSAGESGAMCSAQGSFAVGALNGSASVEVRRADALLRSTGTWKRGVREGQHSVLLFSPPTAETPIVAHVGNFMADKRHGSGQTKLRVSFGGGPSRSVHISGQWRNGAPDGEVAVSLDCAERYRSVWAHGRPTNAAAFVMPTGVFTGAWDPHPPLDEGAPHARATVVCTTDGDESTRAPSVGCRAIAALQCLRGLHSGATGISSVAAAHALLAVVDEAVVAPARQLEDAAAALCSVSGAIVAAMVRNEAADCIASEAGTARKRRDAALRDADRLRGETAKLRSAHASKLAAREAAATVVADLQSTAEQLRGDVVAMQTRLNGGATAASIQAEIDAAKQRAAQAAAEARQASLAVNERRAAQRSGKARGEALATEIRGLEAERERVAAHVSNCGGLLDSTRAKLAAQQLEYERLLAAAQSGSGAAEAAVEDLRAAVSVLEADNTNALLAVQRSVAGGSGAAGSTGDDETALEQLAATLRAQIKSAGDERSDLGARVEAAQRAVADADCAARAAEVALETATAELADAAAEHAERVALRKELEARHAVGLRGNCDDSNDGGESRSQLEERHARAVANLTARTSKAKISLAECKRRIEAARAAKVAAEEQLRNGRAARSKPPSPPPPQAAPPAGSGDALMAALSKEVDERLRRVDGLRRQRETLTERVAEAQRLVDREAKKAAAAVRSEKDSTGRGAGVVVSGDVDSLKAALDALRASNERAAADVAHRREQLAALNDELQRERRRADARSGPPPSTAAASTADGDWRLAALQGEVDSREQRIAALRNELKRVQLLEVNLTKAHETHKFLSERRGERGNSGNSGSSGSMLVRADSRSFGL